MRNFVSSVALAAVVVAFGAGASSAQDSEQAAKRHAAFDRDKSGDVSLEEFTRPMKGRIVRADKNKDGRAMAAELAETMKLEESSPAVAGMLARFDTNKDGGITVTEVENRRANRFKAIDADGDGKLTLAEFQTPPAKAAKGDKPKTTTP